MQIEKFNLEIKLGYGSSCHHPEYNGITTRDIRLWIKYKDEWFKPNYFFNKQDMEIIINSCNDEQQLDYIMNRLKQNLEV